MVFLTFRLLRLWNDRPQAILVDFLRNLSDWRPGKDCFFREMQVDRYGNNGTKEILHWPHGK